MNMGIDQNLMFKAINDDYEEDVFYAELRKQILLLTADDDDDDDYLGTAMKSSKRSMVIPVKPARSCFNGWQTESGNFAPSWLVNLWRNGNVGGGTGVFIPHINVKSRRKQGSGKKNNSKRRKCKQLEENNHS